MDCPVNPLHYCSGDSNATKKKGHFWPPSEAAETKETYMEAARLQSTTPQPYFLKGYTGYTPGSLYHSTGLRYGQYTNELMADHRVAGARLNRIPSDCVVCSRKPPKPQPGNPHVTVEPHFMPGYTGFTPGSGIKRSEGIGQTYGGATHASLAKHFLKGGRLRPILEYPADYIAEEEDAKFYCYEHELTRDDIKRRHDVIPGYTGHIPRAVFRHGRNRTKVTEESIAEFQKILNKNR